MAEPQRQDSLTAQLIDVATLAEQHGCYDAADWIRRQLKVQAHITPELRAGALQRMRENA